MSVNALLSFLIVLQQIGEDVPVLQALVDIGVFVVQVVDLFPQQPVVVLLEGLAGPPGLVGPKAELGQGFYPRSTAEPRVSRYTLPTPWRRIS